MKKHFDIKRVCEVIDIPQPKTNFERLELSYSQVKALVVLDLINRLDNQNYSPTIEEFLDFCEDNNTSDEEIIFECYIVSGDRDDRRLTIEGIRLLIHLASEKAKEKFILNFRMADEFDICNQDGYMRAWWD